MRACRHACACAADDDLGDSMSDTPFLKDSFPTESPYSLNVYAGSRFDAQIVQNNWRNTSANKEKEANIVFARVSTG